ncbi:MAG: hypothetical protein IKE01_02145 [Clostridia bacterium]|nr:hypothetical protein [Clostridia bacterium]
MRKYFLYILIIVCLVFVIPFLFTMQFPKIVDTIGNVEETTQNSLDKQPYDYSNFSTIKLLNTETNETTEIGLDDYLLRRCIGRDASRLSYRSFKSSSCCCKNIYFIYYNS